MNYPAGNIYIRETLGEGRDHAAWVGAEVGFPDNQQGATGIEAAIVLIAFVIVA